MTETTIIPASGATGSPGFHSSDDATTHHFHGKNDLSELLILQQLSNEGRHNQKSVFDAAFAHRDSMERALISQKADSERLMARIDDTRLETVRQIEAVRLEIANRTADTNERIAKAALEQSNRELSDAKLEIQLLKLKNTNILS